MSFSFHSFYDGAQVAKLKEFYLPLTKEEREEYFLTKANDKGRWVAILEDKFRLETFNDFNQMRSVLVRQVSEDFMYYKDLVIFDRYTCKEYTFPELYSRSKPLLDDELKSFKDTVLNVIESIDHEEGTDWSGLKLW